MRDDQDHAGGRIGRVPHDLVGNLLARVLGRADHHDPSPAEQRWRGQRGQLPHGEVFRGHIVDVSGRGSRVAGARSAIWGDHAGFGRQGQPRGRDQGADGPLDEQFFFAGDDADWRGDRSGSARRV